MTVETGKADVSAPLVIDARETLTRQAIDALLRAHWLQIGWKD
jgi:hypothetical protein